MDYCLALEFPQAGEGCAAYPKKGESYLQIADILRLRLERKQKPQKVNVRRIPCTKQLPIIQQQQDAEGH